MPISNPKPLANIHELLQKTNQLETQLLYQATHDSLTGLPNRAVLLERIQQAITLSKGSNLSVGLLLFDIDQLKRINDSLGYDVGDLLLKEVAKRLSDLVPQSGLVVRLGGDEFAVMVVMSECNQDYLVSLANRFLRKFSEHCVLANHSIMITSSVGISLYPLHGKDGSTLLKNADSAMYVAKKEGRNSCRIYQDKFNQSLLQRLDLENALYHALERNELVLYYQPIIDLKTEAILGVEALIRWRHPTLGFIAPLDFIGLAEETGLIVPIGNWVICKASQQMHDWIEKGLRPLRIAVNISMQQFHQSHFVAEVENILSEVKLDSDLLEFELTEKALFGDEAAIFNKMVELRNMGVHLVMDGFGTGYASLNYLKKFPFEKVKIDKNFIQGICETSEDAAIVAAVIAFTKKMQLQVVALGVETYGQLNFLRDQASDQIQGFIFSKPLTEQACFQLLKEKCMIKN